jgi:hypothetical protein
MQPFVSASPDPTKFIIPSFSLRVNGAYLVLLNVSSTLGGRTIGTCTASLRVAIAPGRVFAVILGTLEINVKVTVKDDINSNLDIIGIIVVLIII